MRNKGSATRTICSMLRLIITTKQTICFTCFNSVAPRVVQLFGVQLFWLKVEILSQKIHTEIQKNVSVSQTDRTTTPCTVQQLWTYVFSFSYVSFCSCGSGTVPY